MHTARLASHVGHKLVSQNFREICLIQQCKPNKVTLIALLRARPTDLMCPTGRSSDMRSWLTTHRQLPLGECVRDVSPTNGRKNSTNTERSVFCVFLARHGSRLTTQNRSAQQTAAMRRPAAVAVERNNAMCAWKRNRGMNSISRQRVAHTNQPAGASSAGIHLSGWESTTSCALNGVAKTWIHTECAP